MVKFTEITEQTIRAIYIKDDIPECKVEGYAVYNIEHKLTDAKGTIRDNDDVLIAHFRLVGSDEFARVNLTECAADKMTMAVEIAHATLADLNAAYPQV